MNNELQVAMTDFVNKINNGVDVISENTPLAIDQFITWNLIGHYLGLVVCLVLFVASFGGPFYLHHKDKQKDSEGDARNFLIISWVVFLPDFIGIVVNLIDIVKISFFTEWYLVQEASKFIN